MANCNQNRYLRFWGSFINPKEKNWYHVNIVHSSGKKCPECFFLFTHECTKRICRNEIITGASVQNGKDLYTVSWRFRRGAFSWNSYRGSMFLMVWALMCLKACSKRDNNGCFPFPESATYGAFNGSRLRPYPGPRIRRRLAPRSRTFSWTADVGCIYHLENTFL